MLAATNHKQSKSLIFVLPVSVHLHCEMHIFSSFAKSVILKTLNITLKPQPHPPFISRDANYLPHLTDELQAALSS